MTCPNPLAPKSQRLLVGLVVVGALAAGAELGAQAPGADGVIRVQNGAAPANGLKIVQLEEMWRAGGEDGEVIFGHIFRAEADADLKETQDMDMIDRLTQLVDELTKDRAQKPKKEGDNAKDV